MTPRSRDRQTIERAHVQHDQGGGCKARFILPWPTSVNRIWTPVTRRHQGGSAPALAKSKAAREYLRNAHLMLAAQGVPKLGLAGHLEIEITAHPPANGRQDVDNCIKLTLDTLVRYGLVADDRFFTRVAIEKGPSIRAQGTLDIQLKLKGNNRVR